MSEITFPFLVLMAMSFCGLRHPMKSTYERFVEHCFPNAGSALDVAAGLGRRTLWLAEKSWQVKRPDFLGESRWDFRHGKQSIEARVDDHEWMTRFRNGEEILRPGDALKATARSVVRYGHDGDVVDAAHQVVKVQGVIHPGRPFQHGLLNPGEEPES